MNLRGCLSISRENNRSAHKAIKDLNTMPKAKLLVIDDENRFRELLSRILALEGYEVAQAANANKAWELLKRTDIQIVLTDVRLPDANGIELLQRFREKYPQLAVIVMTAQGSIQDGVQAMKLGAFDYLVKGEDNEQIIPIVERANEKVSVHSQLARLQQLVSEKYSFDNIIGSSAGIRAAVELAKKVAPTDTTVLLLGETGTGKEVFAQAIHQASARAAQPIVAINCSAIAKDLLESELFGHTAGAFTGALKAKRGLVEEAHLGTLFLDEVGELEPDLQAKLLRFLETGTYYKVGESRQQYVNTRLIAATNRDLLKEIESGRFRADLYYRLSVFSITLPPLRERLEDIGPIAALFTRYYAAKTNKVIAPLNQAFLVHLNQLPYKGNIRELKNLIERAVILADGEQLTHELLPASALGEPAAAQMPTELEAVERLHILKILDQVAGNKPEAARLLGIGLTTLYRKLQEYGM